ncbi:MAG: glycosyltransferase, partial [Clostridia bacterium]|nr:glycosyltransferase [Clostridia bacterium]
GNYDLIHCHTPVGGVMGRMMGKKYKIPVLYIAHGFHFYKGAPLINRLVYKTIEKYFARFTDALVTMNEEDYLAAKKMKAKNVYKIDGIGYEKQHKIDNVEDLKSDLNIKDDDFVILSVGELNKNKNHIAVIDALHNINDLSIKYLICGRGPKKEYLENVIEQYGLDSNVKLLGYRKDIDRILNLANVFVMPSIREGLPMSMMEAMDAGLPIIASDIRGCKDLVENNKNGILVNLKDKNGFINAIKTLRNDLLLCEQFGNKNKELIEKYRTNKILSQMEKIYDHIL